MAMLDQKNVMSKASKDELEKLDGGTSITGSLINAVTDCIKTIFDIGRSLGSSFRRVGENKMCEIS